MVDGYADLDPGGRPSPGAYGQAGVLHPVDRVAKSRSGMAAQAGLPVLRRTSVRLLFVTAAGMPSADAADLARTSPHFGLSGALACGNGR